MPVIAAALTTDGTTAALPGSTATPVNPVTTAAPAAKAAAKPDAASATASTDTNPTSAAGQPVSPTPAPASAPIVADGAGRDAKAAAETPEPGTQTQSASNDASSASLNGLAGASAAPQTPVQTTASLAAANGPSIASQIATQVVKSVDGKSTRFDITLDPAGLGSVNVKVEIGAQGQVTAQLSFDNAHSAAEAKSQAGQLQQALEQAGFNVSQGGLSFDVNGQGAGFAGQHTPSQQQAATPVRAPDLIAAAATVSAAPSSRPASGVDITI